jgi:hypothetical protein
MSIHNRHLRYSPAVLTFLLAAIFVFSSCDKDTAAPPTPSTKYLVWNFETDLDGWSVGSGGNGWGTVTWLDKEGGIVKLDGSDEGTLDGEPNSWLHKSITLPAKASILSFRTCPHDRDGATGSLRVQLEADGGTRHTLLDWEQLTGVEGQYIWVNRSADIAEFAGKAVRIYFQQGDDDIGTHEQRYVDTIKIKYIE